MSNYVPLVQNSESMSSRPETFDHYVENALFNDIQDLLDSVGHVDPSVSGYGDQLNGFNSFHVIDAKHETGTVNAEKHSTKDTNIADDTETDKPDMLHLVGEVSSDIQYQENKKTKINSILHAGNISTKEFLKSKIMIKCTMVKIRYVLILKEP